MTLNFNKQFRIAILIALALFIGGSLVAQIHVSGRIVDSQTNEALPYASVYFVNAKVGTVTNQEGYFSIQSNLIQESLLIRYVGYKPFRIAIKSDKNLKIKLNRGSYDLSAVEIIGNTNVKKWAELIRAAVKHQKSSTGFSETTSKAFATNYTYKDDSTLIEAYETFYSTRHTNVKVLYNRFKNGIVRADKLKGRNFRTENMFSFGLSHINIFYTGGAYRPAIGIKSPLSYLTVNDILENFELTPTPIDSQIVKIQFYSKNSESLSGYFIINQVSKRFYKVCINNYYKEREQIITSTNKNYKVKNQSLNIEVVFDQNSVNNYPKLYNLNFSFDYFHTSTQTAERKKVNSKLLIYKYDDEFSRSLPSLTNLNDYENLALIPVFEILWQTETMLLKTKKEEKTINKFNTVKGINTRYEIVLMNDYDYYVHKIPTDSSYHKKVINIESFILCNYYKINGKYYVTAHGIIDYEESRYPFFLDNEALNEYKKAFFDTTLFIAQEFEKRLNSIEPLDVKRIKKEYKIVVKEYKTLKKELLDEYLGLYKEGRSNMEYLKSN